MVAGHANAGTRAKRGHTILNVSYNISHVVNLLPGKTPTIIPVNLEGPVHPGETGLLPPLDRRRERYYIKLSMVLFRF